MQNEKFMSRKKQMQKQKQTQTQKGKGALRIGFAGGLFQRLFRLIFRLPAWGLRLRSDLGGESPGIGERR